MGCGCAGYRPVSFDSFYRFINPFIMISMDSCRASRWRIQANVPTGESTHQRSRRHNLWLLYRQICCSTNILPLPLPAATSAESTKKQFEILVMNGRKIRDSLQDILLRRRWVSSGPLTLSLKILTHVVAILELRGARERQKGTYR
jgi:hypothetical protein